MLDVILLMIAVAMNAGSGGDARTEAGTEAGDLSTASSATAPAFLAPKADPTAPAFLAPKADPTAPAFLAPKAETTAPAPAFLAPARPALVAEPQTPTGRFTTATEVKPILTATRGSWIMVREFNGQDLLYVTQIWSWRCGLLELRVGINGNDPEIWPLPECHMDQPMPSVILEGDGLPYREFAPGSIALIEVELTYDDLSTDSAKFNRQGMLVP